MAATPDFKMQVGDLLPALKGTLSSADGLDLTGCTVTFVMGNADANFNPTGGAPVVTGSATILSATDPADVEYAWIAGDTATPGQYVFQFKVIDSSGRPRRAPTETYKTLQINANLGG